MYKYKYAIYGTKLCEPMFLFSPCEVIPWRASISLKQLENVLKPLLIARLHHHLLGMFAISFFYYIIYILQDFTYFFDISCCYFCSYAKPWSDHVTKKSYCVFFPYSPRQLLSLMPKSDVNLEKDSESGVMYVSIVASLREDPSVMGSSRAPFVGGFSIAEGKVLQE